MDNLGKKMKAKDQADPTSDCAKDSTDDSRKDPDDPDPDDTKPGIPAKPKPRKVGRKYKKDTNTFVMSTVDECQSYVSTPQKVECENNGRCHSMTLFSVPMSGYFVEAPDNVFG